MIFDHSGKFVSQDMYVTCPKKGHPRKHVNVCRRCRWKNCRPYQRWLQPELPLVFKKPRGRY